MLPASVLIGGMFRVLADTAAPWRRWRRRRSAFGAGEIPRGVVTVLCGGPFSIYLLRRQGNRTVE